MEVNLSLIEVISVGPYFWGLPQLAWKLEKRHYNLLEKNKIPRSTVRPSFTHHCLAIHYGFSL